MKGFLNKVQGKVGGKNANGAGAETKPAANAAVPAPQQNAMAAIADQTPRADISLPKGKERR